MKLVSLITVLAFAGCTGLCLGLQLDKGASGSDKLSAMDETEHWQYPYQATEEKRQALLGMLDGFKDPEPIGDFIRKVGAPDRIDDLRKEHKPLSHYEDGFIAGKKGRFPTAVYGS